jgi:hypothetical protein
MNAFCAAGDRIPNPPLTLPLFFGPSVYTGIHEFKNDYQPTSYFENGQEQCELLADSHHIWKGGKN